VQVRKFQDALNDIKSDMRVWKQGMTINSESRFDNFLQPETGITGISSKNQANLDSPSLFQERRKSSLV